MKRTGLENESRFTESKSTTFNTTVTSHRWICFFICLTTYEKQLNYVHTRHDDNSEYFSKLQPYYYLQITGLPIEILAAAQGCKD